MVRNLYHYFFSLTIEDVCAELHIRTDFKFGSPFHINKNATLVRSVVFTLYICH